MLQYWENLSGVMCATNVATNYYGVTSLYLNNMRLSFYRVVRIPWEVIDLGASTLVFEAIRKFFTDYNY